MAVKHLSLILVLCTMILITSTAAALAACSNNESGNPGQSGEIEYFTATNLLRYCDKNDNWVTMCDAINGCNVNATPCSTAGQFYLNETDNVYEWCDGTNTWYMGPLDGANSGICNGLWDRGNLRYENGLYYFCASGNVTPIGTSCSSCGGNGSEKVAFVHQNGSRGDIGGLTGADALCQSDATAGGLSGTYMAWLANASSSPDNRFSTAIKSNTYSIVMPDGTLIANDWNDLTDGAIANGLNVTAYAAPRNATVTFLHSNVDVDGTIYSSNHCDNWTSDSSSDDSARGRYPLTSNRWTQDSGGTQGCNNNRSFYCFEQ